MLRFTAADQVVHADDAGRRWHEPVGLRPALAADGAPQVMLGCSPDGGLLQLRLEAVWPEPLPVGAQALRPSSGRFRLVPHAPGHGDSGRWWPTSVDGALVVDRAVATTGLEARLGSALLPRGEEACEVEVELGFEGYAASMPWLASIAAAPLQSRLRALLANTAPQALQADTVEATFLGLGLDDFDWYPLAPAALMSGQDEALRAIAAQWSRLLFEFDGAGDGPWRWRADLPSHLDADLRQPTGLRWRRALRWSFADFLSTQPDPARHVVDLSTPAPLDAAPLLIVNDLPLSPLGVQELLVEVRSGGPGGMLSHAFRPGEAGAASLRYVRRSFDEQALSWRCRATIATSDGPVVQTSDFRPGSPLVEVSAQALGLKVLRLAAQAEVFDLVPTLEVTVGSRRHALSRTAPASWAIGRQPPPQALLTAVSSTGQRAELGAVPLSPTGLLVGVPQLGLQSMAAVRLDAPGSLSASLAYLAVEIEGLGWHSLEPGGAFEFSWPRASAFDPPAWRYRTRHVPRLADGRTQPWVDSGWHATTGTVAELVLS